MFQLLHLVDLKCTDTKRSGSLILIAFEIINKSFLAFCLNLTVIEVDMNISKEKSSTWNKMSLLNMLLLMIRLSIIPLLIKIVVVGLVSGHCVFGCNAVYSYSIKALSIKTLRLVLTIFKFVLFII